MNDDWAVLRLKIWIWRVWIWFWIEIELIPLPCFVADAYTTTTVVRLGAAKSTLTITTKAFILVPDDDKDHQPRQTN